MAELSFKVNEGEILGLIGPNGAGKSTVFNLINGVYPPDTGRIVFDGQDITGEQPYRVARHGLARAHQIVQPLGGLSVLDNCTVGACFGRENLPLAEAREVAREVAGHRRARRPHRYARRARSPPPARSGSNWRARLSARPKLLLLDEVLAGLNPTEVEHMIATIRGIRERGIAILMIEHVMRAIMSLSDRIVVLNLGRKLPKACRRQVANDPKVIEAYLGDPKLASARSGRHDRREPTPAAGRGTRGRL